MFSFRKVVRHSCIGRTFRVFMNIKILEYQIWYGIGKITPHRRIQFLWLRSSFAYQYPLADIHRCHTVYLQKENISLLPSNQNDANMLVLLLNPPGGFNDCHSTQRNVHKYNIRMRFAYLAYRLWMSFGPSFFCRRLKRVVRLKTLRQDANSELFRSKSLPFSAQ